LYSNVCGKILMCNFMF